MCPHRCAPPQPPGAASVAPETATEIPQLPSASASHFSPSAGETIRTSMGGPPTPESETPASDPPAAPAPPDWSTGPQATANMAAQTLARTNRTDPTLGPGGRNGSASRSLGRHMACPAAEEVYSERAFATVRVWNATHRRESKNETEAWGCVLRRSDGLGSRGL